MTPEASQWQPIATAPKDGTRILAYGKGTDMPVWNTEEKMPSMFCVIYWHGIDIEDFEETGEGTYRKVTKRALEAWRPIGKHFFTPTAWMPLPAPPVDAERAGGRRDKVTHRKWWRVQEWQPPSGQWVEIGVKYSLKEATRQAKWNHDRYGRELPDRGWRVVEVREDIRWHSDKSHDGAVRQSPAPETP